MEMIDREADGSDSLEVNNLDNACAAACNAEKRVYLGIRVGALNSRRNRVRNGLFPS